MTGFTDSDYARAASALGAEVAMVRAFAEVESSAAPFWDNGPVPILFEAQWFHHFTGGKYDQSHPGISCPVWDKTLYKGGLAEYDRLREAAALDREAALKSASWGAFQVMGFNYADLGYATITDFVVAMGTTTGQIDSFVKFIQKNQLTTAIRNRDYETLARVYNGPAAVEEYAPRLEKAYEDMLAGNGMGRNLCMGNYGADVVRLQTALGIHVDGIFGRATDSAVRQFQANNGLTVDGIVGPRTMAVLLPPEKAAA